MPYIEINNARIFYRSYGEDHPGRAPVVLIHGSDIDGQTDWAQIAPHLAEQYRVFVPDCRGHGQSANPQHSYRFREMADDFAVFVRAMGYEQAHIIGHSNGGNVALVTLVEHPDIVKTCIPQAANAYVTRHIIEREPVYFDPDRIQREEPERMQEMIAIHGPTHGREYWRELVQLAMQETMSAPNYTPADLQRVHRPTLVIMGEKDGANAPDRHAQYIAEYIPGAELWIPEGIGHNVHIDIPDQWLEKVFDFLERRG